MCRHGPVVAHILDTAAASTGPSDPRLMTLLENDDMAQVGLYSEQCTGRFMFRAMQKIFMIRSSGCASRFGGSSLRLAVLQVELQYISV